MRRVQIRSFLYFPIAISIYGYIINNTQELEASGKSLIQSLPQVAGIEPAAAAPVAPAYEEVGVASWYGPGFLGRRTASGQRFERNGLTAAHRSLPLHTVARVTNLDNGRSVEVTVTDRGPFVHGRVIDLSPRAAKALGMEHAGLALVRIEARPAETRSLAGDGPTIGLGQ